MTQTDSMDDLVRNRIISDPESLLEDAELMRALVAANDRTMGGNIVDLRGIAMERLEARLDRLEDTHRHVIAAAYENLAGTNQIHRAVLRLLEATRFETFLRDLGGEVADILRVDALRLVLESEGDPDEAVSRLGEVLLVAEPGFVEAYVNRGRPQSLRQVTLRQTASEAPELYGDRAAYIRSEACISLDFGEGRSRGMLALGSEDPHLFSPQHGTDLLGFFGGVFERAMRRWLS